MYYKHHFKDKVIYCNCDNPKYSNFWKYFQQNFNTLGIKKLIATFYDPEHPTYKAELTSDNQNPIRTPLVGNGDFRSSECIQLLQEADIIVTNPPFSLFREYVAQLIEHNKKFLIIGNINAVGYKDIFPLIKENIIWISRTKTHQDFKIPASYDFGVTRTDENNNKYATLGNIAWFTNLTSTRLPQSLVLTKSYNPQEYPQYDNYDAIEVSKVKDIPYDYDGVMGVPITFLSRYNPDEYKLLGLTSGNGGVTPTKKYINPVYIDTEGNRKNGSSANTSAALFFSDPPDGGYYTADNIDGYLKVLYKRILIKRIKP